MIANIDRKFLEKINYSEFIVFIIASGLAVFTGPFVSFLSVSMSLVAILSIGFLYLDLVDSKPSWTGLASMVLAGVLCSLLYANLVFSFSILVVVVFRLLKSPTTLQPKLILALLFGTLFGLGSRFVAITNGLSIDVTPTKEVILIATMLIVTLAYVAFEFMKTRSLSKDLLVDAHNSRQRLQKMVTVSNSFSRFVPDQLREPIIQSAVSTKVFNKRAKLTIFFSDIAGFTALSDNLDADTLAEVLTTYMERMTLVAKKHDAVLDKFIGDGMMCFFGAHGYRTDQQNALACVAMAMDMKREMRDLRRKWRKRGFDGLYIRMGINTGYCHVGNFGSENRMSYTVIGKEVNLAARLESVAKPDQVVVSKSTYELICHSYKCRGYGVFELKGFEGKIPCWYVCDKDNHNVNSKSKVEMDKSMPGFDLHLDVSEVKNYDYKHIRNHLIDVIEKLEVAEKMDRFKDK